MEDDLFRSFYQNLMKRFIDVKDALKNMVLLTLNLGLNLSFLVVRFNLIQRKVKNRERNLRFSILKDHQRSYKSRSGSTKPSANCMLVMNNPGVFFEYWRSSNIILLLQS